MCIVYNKDLLVYYSNVLATCQYFNKKMSAFAPTFEFISVLTKWSIIVFYDYASIASFASENSAVSSPSKYALITAPSSSALNSALIGCTISL